jgi:hypothetical protein
MKIEDFDTKREKEYVLMERNQTEYFVLKN